MRVAWLWLLVIACKPTETEKRCAALVDRALACDTTHGITDSMQRSMREYCQVISDEKLDPDDHSSLAYVARESLRECSAATDCASFAACSERHRCSFVFKNVDDHDPQFMCFH